MSNFAEVLAYWYLRLNGFFPLVNYVHHEGPPQDGDRDIVAIRLPSVRETVRGEPIVWDHERFEGFGVNLAEDTVGVIAEVKSGGAKAQPNPDDDYRTKLLGAVERIGILERGLAILATDDLMAGRRHRTAVGSKIVVKILFHDGWLPRNLWAGWYDIDLKRADEFISDRFRRYAEKNRGRMLFPSELMQYLIWREFRANEAPR